MTRGVVIAAVRSGAGKTTVALGLMRAFARRGVGVQPFKCGPDYIDPAFHRVATGRASYNLDGWAMAAGALNRLVDDHGADLAIAEGVMGLFDGVTGRGATADVAALLGWPIVLVLDVKGQTETAAAIAAGCAAYRSDTAIAGVILNRVAGARHLSLIAPAFERIGMKLFGALTNDPRLSLPERHLGLVQAGETVDVERQLDLLADVLQATVDLDAVAASARPSKAGAVTNGDGFFDPPGQRVALARDDAFSFMYPHVVEHWRARGAEMLPFSPLRDEGPALDADAVWLPGGYPELHAGTLASAGRFKRGLRALADRGVPIHGECGGYMVLGQGLEDAEGRRHAMTGLLGGETAFAKPSLHLGYRTARLGADCALGAAGTEILGHEFHYAGVLAVGDDRLVECRDASNAIVAEAGARRGAVSGTFFHAISKRPS